MANRPSGDRPLVLVLGARDTVAVAVVALPPGASVAVERGGETVRVAASTSIPFGHKIALVPMNAGDPVVKYGEVIGYARAAIRPGEHVHIHNVRSARAGARDA